MSPRSTFAAQVSRLLLAGCCIASSAAAVGAAETIDLLTEVDVLRIDGVRIGDKFGAEIASCDFNGDGIEDVVISAPGADGPSGTRFAAGEIYVIHGARRRWTSTVNVLDVADTRIVGPENGDSLGSGVTCRDIDGDVHGDVMGGATNAASIENSRAQAGEAYLIFGGPGRAGTIDLALTPETVIYGASALDAVGDEPAACDVNGDGISDLLIDASNATGPSGQPNTGKLHIVFGRPSWPESIDLLSEADVTILSAEAHDNLAFTVSCGDLDGDGVSDVIADAPGGDGPADGRSNAGDVMVFRGRPIWPPVIDLATDAPDLVVYGADPEDAFGRAGLSVGDLDADGTPDLVVGGPAADGPANDISEVGEVRTVEPGATPPATIDLRTENRSIVYGIDARDWSGNRLHVADVNGDGVDDLVDGAAEADGPNNSRFDSGEVYVIYGRFGFPADLRLANGDYDIVIYGAASWYTTNTPRRSTDINDDGIREIVVRARSDIVYEGTVYLLSPFDVDLDGFTQLADNCPLVANPSQADSDGDGRGDACATDWDGDGQVDAEDCNVRDPLGGMPGPIDDLAFAAGSKERLVWSEVAFANLYDISRGPLSALDGADYGSCQNAKDPDRTDTSYTDPERPPAGDGFFYLVRGHNLVCPASGSWGDATAGERHNQNPLACQ